MFSKIFNFKKPSADYYPLVTVEWSDHYFKEDFMSLEEIEAQASEEYIGSYTGYLVFENDLFYVVSSNSWLGDEEDAIFPTMYILKCAVKSIEYR